MNADTHTSIQFDIMSNWRDLVISSLREYELEADEKKNTEDLYLQLLHRQRRCVEQKKRSLVEATSFSCPASVRDGYEGFKKKVLNGEDLLPHLSKGIQRLTSRDGLLNDWGIHHFHMGEIPKASHPRFAERTPEVLFAVVIPDTFYAIGFRSHEFEDKEILETVQKNWPNLLEPFRHHGIVGMENPHKTPDEIRELRKAGIMTIQAIGNQFFFPPGGGFTSTGDNIQDVGDLNDTIRALKRLSIYLEQKLDSIIEIGKSSGAEIPVRCTLIMEEFTPVLARFREPGTGFSFTLVNF